MMRRLLIGLLAALGIPVLVLAQSGAATGHQHATPQGPASNQNQMMQMHQKMMDEMAAMDQKLDGLVSQMNAAQGQAKVDAMAAVITEMINQRKQMREQMSSMMGRGMMGGMMGGEPEQGTIGTSGGIVGGMNVTFDPVCRAKIANNTAPTAVYQGKTYRFCSEADKQAFLKDPAKYLNPR